MVGGNGKEMIKPKWTDNTDMDQHVAQYQRQLATCSSWFTTP